MKAGLHRVAAGARVLLRTPSLVVALDEVRVAADHVHLAFAGSGRGRDAGVSSVAVDVVADDRRWGYPTTAELRALDHPNPHHAGELVPVLPHPAIWVAAGSPWADATWTCGWTIAPIPAEGDLTLIVWTRGVDVEDPAEIELVLDGDELRAAAANQIAPWGADG